MTRISVDYPIIPVKLLIRYEVTYEDTLKTPSPAVLSILTQRLAMNIREQNKMLLLDLIAEIRLGIYAELLTLPEPIEFRADGDIPTRLPQLNRIERHGLHPEILRVCKLLYHEASPLLYSKNRFHFPQVTGWASTTPNHAYLAPFMKEIRAQANLIHHICIPFPEFAYPVPQTAVLHEVHVGNLELIRTSEALRTLELLVPIENGNYALSYWEIAPQALRLLDRQLRRIHTLQKIVVTFEAYPDSEPDEDLTADMRSLGWIVRIKWLPKKMWMSYDDRVQFDNEEDCRLYNEEQDRREQVLEDRREEERWLGDYYQRRNDPYWRDDPD